MDMMDQYLLSLGLDSSPSILLSKIFLLVFAVLLFNFLVRKLFSQFAVKLQKTENEWDDALLDVARKPLAWGVWVIGMAWVVGIVSHAFDADTLNFVATLRDTLLIMLVSWFAVRLVNVVVAMLARPGKNRDAWDKTTVEAMGKLVKASVIITAILALMQHFGFSISLFVNATAASSGVCAPQTEKSGQIRPIYRGNALSASFRSVNAAQIQACKPPIAYRTHSNTLQRLSVATGLSLVQIHAQDRG